MEVDIDLEYSWRDPRLTTFYTARMAQHRNTIIETSAHHRLWFPGLVFQNVRHISQSNLPHATAILQVKHTDVLTYSIRYNIFFYSTVMHLSHQL